LDDNSVDSYSPVGTVGIRTTEDSSSITEVSHILESNNKLDDMGMVKDLLADNETLIRLLSETAKEADSQSQRGTVNLLEDLIEKHGKSVWMLRSFTQ
jgi:starvation-inducible DNA-binding protein